MFTYPVTVEMSDGATYKVLVDQRDIARLELQELPAGAKVTRVRFLAWSALTRANLTGSPWEQFNATDCVSAVDGDDDESEGEQGLDPGRTAAPGNSSSASPSRPGNRSPGRRGSKAGTPATSTP